MSLDLIISDLDGTLVETEDYHRQAYNKLFEELGLNVIWSKQDYIDRLKVMGGGKLKEIFSWTDLADEDYLAFKNEMYVKKTQLYLELITADLRVGKLDLRPGIRRIFTELQREGIPFAIGTACEKSAAYEVLKAAMGTCFIDSLSALCGGDDASRKKPDPAIYLLVAEKCGVNPRNCLVFEDTRHGMEAALSAGMRCIVAPSEYALHHDFKEATLKVTDFESPLALTVEHLRDLMV